MTKDIYITNICFESIIVPCTCFHKQPSWKESNIKNGLKVKQLSKQPSMLKMLILVGLWVKNFLHNCFWCNVFVYKVFRADTGNKKTATDAFASSSTNSWWWVYNFSVVCVFVIDFVFGKHL